MNKHQTFVFVNIARKWIIPRSKEDLENADRTELIRAVTEQKARLKLIRRVNYQSQRLGIRIYGTKTIPKKIF